ncbi:MAG: 16S rRNA (guanine(527)-N(7))-methyltransferase RsmG [Lachnospiraceae bacterium]|nr:16S rRNA (guanine(527)-N(7))-methyltransferase RsmG [Lachnospiraceae bacterium]
MENNNLLEECLSKFGLELSEHQKNQFVKFYDFLVEKNKVMNLTGITEYDEVVIKHFADSLSIVKICDMSNINSIIDVGTGAGFPGVPIMIMFPQVQVTLMDSLNKRINFLKEACEICDITNVDFVHGRAEDLGRDKKYREQFDLSVSRAVANLSTLSEYCLPFVKVGGSFICYKSGNSDEEIDNAGNAIKKLSGEIVNRVDFIIPMSDNSRTLLDIKKVKTIAKTYPRKAGTPSRNPLS